MKTAPVPCQHIADYYQQKWEEHPCIAWNLLRRGYAQWAAGRPEHLNNLYEEPEMTRPLEDTLRAWDTETFARRKQQYEMFASYHARLTVWTILQRLQARWPDHKLGDMPEPPVDNRV